MKHIGSSVQWPRSTVSSAARVKYRGLLIPNLKWMHHIRFVPESNWLLTGFNAQIAKLCCQILIAPELMKFFEILTPSFMGFGKIIDHPSVRTSEEGLYFIASMILSQIVLKPAYALFVQNGLFKSLDNHQMLGNWECCFCSECSLPLMFCKVDFFWCSISVSYRDFFSGNPLKKKFLNRQKKISQACRLAVQEGIWKHPKGDSAWLQLDICVGQIGSFSAGLQRHIKHLKVRHKLDT